MATYSCESGYEFATRIEHNVTPQERAEWEYKTKVGVAEHISKVQLPATVIQGNNSGGGSANMLESILGVKLLDK